MNKLNLVRNLTLAQNVTRSLGDFFSWTNILVRNFILAKNVTRSSNNIVPWRNSNWWETSSLQRMWQVVWIISFNELITLVSEKCQPCKEFDMNLANVWSFLMNKLTSEEPHSWTELSQVLAIFLMNKLKVAKNLILAKYVTRSLGLGQSFSMNKLTGKTPYPCKECDKKFK